MNIKWQAAAENILLPLRRGRRIFCCIHCLDFTHTSMLAYFQVLYHTSILLKRQTLKKIKKTINNIKIINQKQSKNKYKARFDLKLFTFWSKSASL